MKYLLLSSLLMPLTACQKEESANFKEGYAKALVYHNMDKASALVYAEAYEKAYDGGLADGKFLEEAEDYAEDYALAIAEGKTETEASAYAEEKENERAKKEQERKELENKIAQTMKAKFQKARESPYYNPAYALIRDQGRSHIHADIYAIWYSLGRLDGDNHADASAKAYRLTDQQLRLVGK